MKANTTTAPTTTNTLGFSTTDSNGVEHLWIRIYFTAKGENFERVRVVRDDNFNQEIELIDAEGGTWKRSYFVY